MNEGPFVSVLMTAYNREKYIADAIESVLASTYTNFELIVVDDCSKDRTVEISRRYETRDSRVKVYVNETNLGDYPNRNRAASYAQGKYIKYLDSDDLIYSYTLQAMVEAMERYPDAAMGVSSSKGSTEKPFPHLFVPSTAIRFHFFKYNILDCAPSGAIYNRILFFETGGFSGKRMVGDLEFNLNCASKYPIILLPPGLVFWREHGNQEVFFGISRNMYAPMKKEVMADLYGRISFDILTMEERRRISSGGGILARIKSRLKEKFL
jgi:glycosyltransferase involved in cell wall biosynthesis